MLCPPKPQRTVTFDAAPPAPMKRSCTGYLAVLAVLWSGVSWAQTAGHSQLHEGARQWVAEQTRTPLSALQVTPLDPRLNIPACAKPIQFDLPFGNRQSVRARCDQPAWQHFVQVMARPEALPALANLSLAHQATGRKMDIFPLTYGEPFAGVGPLVVVGVGVGTAAPTTPTTTEQEA